MQKLMLLCCLMTAVPLLPQTQPLSFEVATIKPSTPGDRSGKFARMQSGHEFAVRNYSSSMLQRVVFDRPVVDKTNLTGRYDFDLAWSYDDSQFAGQLPPINLDDANKPSLFSALQTELGLSLASSRAQVETIIIDSVQKPSEN